MSFDETLLREDRDLAFADWGRALTYRLVTQAYHPETQIVEETYQDQTIEVLFEEEPRMVAKETGGAFLKREFTVLVRREEVPGGEVQLDHRLVWDEREYEPVEIVVSEDGALTRIRCRER